MKAVFISDAHLNGSVSEGYRYLIRFLDSIIGDADELFIVGDFYDFWFSDNERVYPGFYDIIGKLMEIKKSGTNISFFEGNHDFFLDDYFAQYGINVYPDSAIIDLDGVKLLCLMVILWMIPTRHTFYCAGFSEAGCFTRYRN